MAALTFRINAEEFRRDMTNILEEKAKGITSDNELYKTVSLNLVDYIKSFLLGAGYYDTGALVDQNTGESEKTHYMREGHLPDPSIGRGIEWSAVEHARKGDREYAEPAISRALDINGYVTGASIREVMENNGTWDEFLEECKEPIIEAMNKNAKG